VTTFAPNALAIGYSPPVTIDLPVPALDLSVEYFQTSDSYINIWRHFLMQLTEEPPKNNWRVPDDCGDVCSFRIQYDAPALSCRELSPEEYTVKAYDSSASNGSWTFYHLDDTQFSVQNFWTANNPSFILNYVPMSSESNPFTTVLSDSPIGSSCQCKDGRYEANFKYANNTIDVSTTILSYSNRYTSTCTGTDYGTASAECNNYQNNSFAICWHFPLGLSGSMGFNPATLGETSDTNYYPLAIENFADYSLNYAGDGKIYFKPKFSNLNEALTSFFANLTLSLLPALNQTPVFVLAEVSDNIQR
jgi:hypothetical protein